MLTFTGIKRLEMHILVIHLFAVRTSPSSGADEQGWGKGVGRICSRAESACSSLICPGPECVTLMCTNLSNTEINEAPAHPRGIHLCG